MDATTQFEDINHTDKAFVLMKDLYIGDFKNPGDDKESWEEYMKRKQREEENQLSLTQKLVLVGLFIVVFTYLYNYLTGNTTNFLPPVEV